MKPQVEPNRRKSSGFMELLGVFLHLEHRLPFFEASAFIFFASVLLFSSVSGGDGYSAYSFMVGVGGISLTSLILVVLILKNMASGWGSDFEKGTMQTFLTYPLGRGKLFFVRLTSSLLLPLGLLTVAQFSIVFLIAPGFASANFGYLLLGYIVSLTTPLLVAAIVVLAVLWAKSGSVPFALGLVAYFFILIFSAILVNIGYASGEPILAWAVYYINPAYAFSSYFGSQSAGFGVGFGYPVVPTYDQSAELLALNIITSLTLILLGAVIFSRRTEV